MQPWRAAVVNQRLLVGAVSVVAVLTMSWGAARAEAAVAGATVTIATDTGDDALFASDAMRPGIAESACLTVSVAEARAGDHVRITALDVSGPLASALTIAVDVGTGGGGGSCVGFSGSRVFSGLLSELAASAATDGVTVGWEPVTAPVRSFRITATVADDQSLQGKSANGRFAWLFVPGTGQEPPPQPPIPSPTRSTGTSTSTIATDSSTGPPTASPTESQSGSESTSQTTSPSSASDTAATASATTTASATPDTVGRRPGAGAGPGSAPPPTSGPGGADIEVTDRFDIALARTVVALGSDPQYPIALFLVVLVFLMVQHGMDLTDPKLAKASVTQRDNELAFADPFAPPGPAS